MTGPYSTAIIVVALVLALWALALAALNRRPGPALLLGAAVLEAMLVVFLIGGIVQMIGSHHPFARAEFVVYLLGTVAIPLLAYLWSWGEPSRTAALVVAVAFLITPVMVIRVQQVWAGPHG